MRWRTFRDRYLVTPVAVDNTVPPADIVPGFPPADVVDLDLDNTPAAPVDRDLVLRRLLNSTLVAESLKDPPLRNGALMDFCLEVRTILRPPAPGSEVLRETPAVGIRYAVPVVPGRAL